MRPLQGGRPGPAGGGSRQPNSYGVYASPPAAPKDGDVHFCSDSPVRRHRVAGAWVDSLPGFGTVSVPTVASVTAVNSPVLTDAGGLLVSGAADAGAQLRLGVRSTIATPWAVTTAFDPIQYDSFAAQSGLVLRASGSGKVIGYRWGKGADTGLAIDTWDSPTAYAGTVGAITLAACPRALRITDDGATRAYQITFDGSTWHTIYSEANTTHLTANQYGVYTSCQNATLVGSARFHHLAIA